MELDNSTNLINSNQKYLNIKFNWKIVAFLILIEIFTIPFVAISNTLTAQSQFDIAIMGFIIAFPALFIILKILLPRLHHSLSISLNLNIIKIHGVLYIGIISGVLLTFMFYLQELTYHFTNSDCIVGLVSAFFSVGISLIFYQLVQKYFNYGITLITAEQKFVLTLNTKDIIVLTLLFTLYETIASPISIIWLPHLEQRFWWGILSGILSGLGGGIPLAIISKLTGYQINVGFRRIF